MAAQLRCAHNDLTLQGMRREVYVRLAKWQIKECIGDEGLSESLTAESKVY